MKTPHQYQALLIDIANGEQMQVLHENLSIPYWVDCNGNYALIMITSHRSIRVKPSTIMIGGVEVPEPMRVTPIYGATCYMVDLANSCTTAIIWAGYNDQRKWLKSYVVQATEKGAEEMLAALLKQLKA